MLVVDRVRRRKRHGMASNNSKQTPKPPTANPSRQLNGVKRRTTVLGPPGTGIARKARLASRTDCWRPLTVACQPGYQSSLKTSNPGVLLATASVS